MKALLAPASFSEMYNVASKGYHSVLQRAIDRGLNIDSLDRNGNTGLCVAILRRDCRAYNSFATVGANRHHYCVSQIPKDHYDSFMNSGCIAPFLFGARPMVAEENSRKLALFWIFIGVAAITATAIALSSGGGSSSTEDSSGGGGSGGDDPDNPGGGDDPDNPGGGDDPDNPGGGDDPDNPGGGDDPDNPGGGEDPDDPDNPDNPGDPDDPEDPDPDEPYDPDNPGGDQDEIGDYDPTQDLASQSGTLTPAEGKPLTDGSYTTVMNSVTDKKTLSLEDDITVVNESLIEDEEDKTKKVLVSDAIDWSQNSILKDAGYLRTGGKAVGMSKIINAAAANLTVKNASVGLAATGQSTAENQGVINVLATNAAIGMAAGQRSKAHNMGTLNLNLTDSTKDKNRIIGMYGDTNSRLLNDTQIMGSVVNSTAGGMTGMQVNLLRVNKGVTKAVNTGEITFNMGADAVSGNSSVVITGMKSVYDKLLEAATETVLSEALLTNEGSIKLSNDTWKDATSLQLIGIDADKRTTVDNKGGSIEISSKSANNSYAVKSAGAMSISNSGSILMNGYNDFGIYHTGGNDDTLIKNEGTLDFGSENSIAGTAWGIYAEKRTGDAGNITIENTGTITIDKVEADAKAIHGIGVQKISNDTSLTIAAKNAYGVILDNENKDIGTLLFDGELDIKLSGEAYGVKLINGVLSGAADEKEDVTEDKKKGATANITISGAVPEDDEDAQLGTATAIFMDKKSSGMNSGSIEMRNLVSATGIYANEESSLTNKGDISISKSGSAVGIYANKKSRVTNESMISIEDSKNLDNVGMYAGVESTVTNAEDGSISIGGTGTGMKASPVSSGAVNQGSISVDEYGYGMYILGPFSYGENSGSITVGSGIGVVASGSSFSNIKSGDRVGSITVNADGAIGIEGSGSIYNSGTIDVMGDYVTGIQTSGLSTDVTIADGSVTVTGKGAVGVYDTSSLSYSFSVGSDAALTVSASGNEEDDVSYAVYGEHVSRFNNEGEITIDADNAYGAKLGMEIKDTVNGVEVLRETKFYNNGKITVSGKNINGVDIYKATEAVNDEKGEIVLDSAGIAFKSDQSEMVKNLGTIQILRGKTTGVVDIDDANFVPVAVGMDITGGEFEIGPAVVDEYGFENANVLVNSDASRGVAVHGGATGVNKGVIEMSGDYTVGIYADETGSAGVLNQGKINISGNASIGMYADGNALMINDTDGEISVSGTNAVGMKARGAGAVIENRGKIYVNSVEDTDGSSLVATDGGTINSGASGASYSALARAIVLEDGATFINSGEAVFDGAVDFDEAGDGTVVAAKSGTFVATSFKGNVTAAADITTGSNLETYVAEDAFVGENSGLNLLSASHMFGAALAENDNGGLDVVMTRRSFSDLTDNSSVASFLEKNYQENNRVDLFDVLKSASGAQGFNDNLASELGMNFFPNFARENLDVMKSLGRSMNNSLLENTDDRAERVIAGTDNFYRDRKASGGVVGYKNVSNSLYGIADKRYNNNWRYGVGASVSELNSDYDGGSERKETVFQMFVPVLYNSSEYKLLSTLKAGYGFGSYKRTLGAHTYKADTENFYYGLTNEARKNIDAGSFAIQPTAEFNIQGVYIGKTRENDGIDVHSVNNLSVEAGIGLYAVKMYEFYNQDKLNLRAGATYYYEFGDPYADIEAGMAGMSGTYTFDGYKLRRSRVVAGVRADYLHDSLNLYLAANKYFETNSGYEINLGLEWRF